MQQEKLHYFLEEIPPESPKSKITTFSKIRITLTTTIQEYHNGVFTLHDDADEVAAA